MGFSNRLGLGFFITTFNPDYAKALGISTLIWHFVFMSLVSLTTVISFESVGAILVVALLIAPPATAYLLTGRLRRMLLYTAIISLLVSIGGYALASWLNGSIAGAMATVAGILFAGAYAVYKTKANRRTKVSFQKLPS
ncbi:MAG TPA: hypothetical protein DIU20_00505 [Cryomorphaceae bacterium]|nr:hypothetical protein [Cryomorphaceae bacterium]